MYFSVFLYTFIKFMIVTQLRLKVIDFEGFKFNDLKTKILRFDFSAKKDKDPENWAVGSYIEIILPRNHVCQCQLSHKNEIHQ